jgi:hypothetical protein
MNRVMMEVLPTEAFPRKTSLNLLVVADVVEEVLATVEDGEAKCAIDNEMQFFVVVVN